MVEKITWSEIENMCSVLERKLEGILPDDAVLIAVMRGGATPTVLLSDMIGIRKTGAIWTYGYEGTQRLIEPKIIRFAMPDGTPVFVDDIVDSGGTMRTIKRAFPDSLFVTLVTRPDASVPDKIISARVVQDWCEFPWCRKDSEGKGNIICEYKDNCSYPWKNIDKCNHSTNRQYCDIFQKRSVAAGKATFVID